MTATATKEHVRLLQLLDAAGTAGLAPIDLRALHTLAYFANVLSPVWNLPPMDGKVLRRTGGPFYPVLQHDLDRLVGLGMVFITSVGHDQDEDGRWRLRGEFVLNRTLARSALETLGRFEDESRFRTFLRELANATTSFPDETIEHAPLADPTYGDPISRPGNVVDFAEWQQRNYVANAARHFRSLVPPGITATEGELLHLYVRHLRSRLTS